MPASHHNHSLPIMNVIFNLIVAIVFIFPTNLVLASAETETVSSSQALPALPVIQAEPVTIASTNNNSEKTSLVYTSFFQRINLFEKWREFPSQSSNSAFSSTDTSIHSKKGLRLFGSISQFVDPAFPKILSYQTTACVTSGDLLITSGTSCSLDAGMYTFDTIAIESSGTLVLNGNVITNQGVTI
jgi:hypothetical protein